jgi:hypothetical protein
VKHVSRWFRSARPVFGQDHGRNAIDTGNTARLESGGVEVREMGGDVFVPTYGHKKWECRFPRGMRIQRWVFT